MAIAASAGIEYLAGMEYLEIPPPSGLESVVRCFWFLRSAQGSAIPEPVVPDGHPEIILHLADPYWTMKGRPERQSNAVLAGQLTRPLVIRSGTVVDVVGIRFRTSGIRAVIGHPLFEFSDGVTDLEAVDRPLARELHTAAALHATPTARAKALSSVVAGRIRLHRPVPTEAIVFALSNSGRDPISAVARRFGMSRRTFERTVRADTGLSPHLLRQVLRFRTVFPLLDRTPRGRWSGLAQRAGYYDQAHMIREFKRFAGEPPSTFFGDDPDLSRHLLANGGSEAHA